MTKKKTIKKKKQVSSKRTPEGETEKFGESETFLVSTVWKNAMQYGPQQGQAYWNFVLADGSRIPCYDSGVVKATGIDINQQRTYFDPPQEFEFEYELRKDKTIITGFEGTREIRKQVTPGAKYNTGTSNQAQYSKTPPYKKTYYSKSPADNEAITRMSVLRTAVEFLAYQKVKTQAVLQKITSEFESFVKTGKW